MSNPHLNEGPTLGDILQKIHDRANLPHAYQHGRVHVVDGMHNYYDTLTTAWQREIHENKIIEGIKLYRLLFGCSLKEARDACIHYRVEYHHRRARELVQEAVVIMTQNVTPDIGNINQARGLIMDMIK